MLTVPCREGIQGITRDAQERVPGAVPAGRAGVRSCHLLPDQVKRHASPPLPSDTHANGAAGLGPNLTPNILLQFINAKGNILLALTSGTTAPTALVSLLSELDISLPDERTGLVVDHFNYDATSASDHHDVVLLPAPAALRPDVKNLFGPATPVDELLAFPRGVGQTLGNGPLLAPIVRAPRTAYSYNPKEQGEVVDELFAAGAQLSLVSAVQARNSARFVVVGSAEMLSDKWFDAKVKKAGGAKAVGTYNREFAKKVSGWTFQETGVLRVNWVEHHLNEQGAANASNPKIYRIKNDVVCFPLSFRQHIATGRD